MLLIKLSIYGRKFMVIPQTDHKLSINKVGKNSQILCAHLDPFRWPSHIYGIDCRSKIIVGEHTIYGYNRLYLM